jgi:hypothetical protein
LEDFASAAVRHWDTAVFLGSAGRWQQAAYLAGYLAECSLKALLKLASPSILPRPLGHNLAALSGDALEMAWVLTPATRRYRVKPVVSGAPGIADWRPEHRYERTGFRPLKRFRQTVEEAQLVGQSVLIELVLDGKMEDLPL